MRKALIAHEKPNATESTAWLDLAAISSVEITSEDEQQPIEHALTPGGGGWQAAAKGSQIVRMRFDEPAAVGTIQLHIIERSRSGIRSWLSTQKPRVPSSARSSASNLPSVRMDRPKSSKYSK